MIPVKALEYQGIGVLLNLEIVAYALFNITVEGWLQFNDQQWEDSCFGNWRYTRGAALYLGENDKLVIMQEIDHINRAIRISDAV